jgi:hypothetical protein
MREAGSRWRNWTLVAGVVTAAAAALWDGNPFGQSARASILESARRVNGDVMLLSLDTPPADVDQVRDMASNASSVVDASVVAIWEVQIESAATRSSGFLQDLVEPLLRSSR